MPASSSIVCDTDDGHENARTAMTAVRAFACHCSVECCWRNTSVT
ncbi:hypothetical protein SAMN05216381_3253 [Pseudomonas seleniipraecipitans]|uniref:Uncharacterized protein n=1 Tax=Phytopseudomonas seleniipraecipitans TaxID=640205 RepID=A0A1G7RTI5_9GAMM|nr:hypothetical protein SAMN05216381_3253 [Pseudomonas seleniipraecipitans]